MSVKIYLMDIVGIRLVLIVLLILYHALCIYTNAWSPPIESFNRIEVYDWLGTLTHSFQLEGMVFISGLLLGYKTKLNPETFNFKLCIVRKAKRILLPCFIFGFVYYILFYDLSLSLFAIAYRIINGCGHLWFLPMLFWCFFITYLLLHNCNINTHRRYILLLLITFIFTIINPLIRLPLGLGSVGYYYFYFLLGFLLRSEVLSLPLFNSKNVFIAILLFIFSYVEYMLVRNSVVNSDDHFHKIIKLFISNSLHFFNAMSAIFLLYGFSNSVKIVHFLKNKHSLIILSGYCYGVYIYQQFILQILYYKTSFPLYINEYWLPWIAFVITLCLSLMLCHVTLKCKLGRFLLG